jgi:hypothetical protein
MENNFVQVTDSAFFGFTASVCQQAKWQFIIKDVRKGLSTVCDLFSTAD